MSSLRWRMQAPIPGDFIINTPVETRHLLRRLTSDASFDRAMRRHILREVMTQRLRNAPGGFEHDSSGILFIEHLVVLLFDNQCQAAQNVLVAHENRGSNSHYASIEFSAAYDMTRSTDWGERSFEFLPIPAEAGIARFVGSGFVNAPQLGSREKRQNCL